ncbi:hypothetical protein [Deinococcus aestuarii]|uniref:hypothetical protein n=1 Tax=Deinococcus aestuarii TaxID=2774531 RepID=UPI001C0D0DA1|nr:hypothetical protein [Deinococcus aestuarii]
MGAVTLSSFLFIVLAPEGVWRARFELEPGRCYRPDDVRLECGPKPGWSPHTLTVEATTLPSEDEFRVLAARAATRTADDTPDELRRLLNLLIPF